MQIRVKLRRFGNSKGIILPANVITGYNVGDVITLNVITDTTDVITPAPRPQASSIASPAAPPVVYCERPAQWSGELTKERQIGQKGFNV